MLRRLGGVSVVVAGLVLTPLASGSAHADDTAAANPGAAAECAYSPNSLLLGSDAKAVKFEVPDAGSWRVQVPALGIDAAPGHVVKNFLPKTFKNSQAGLSKATITRDGTTCTSTFRLRRPSMLTMVVIHKHPYRYLGGKVVRSNYGEGLPVRSPIKGARIAVQRLTKQGWVTEKWMTTDKKGFFIGKAKIGKRTWRAMLETSVTTQGNVSKAATNETEWADIKDIG
ncbi:hypothetical protein KIH74_17295 [Kineosporia sp. J2-2]|uniref:Uncharacterized protein n=1 Tax=Kineosporia corallincola TaxID=2835133 RepID=A0ABS5THY6_9ACTN|nr:hypothetical protein [Kineosporia corallincola]MBT0770703.1 hypothetical protein [Kineosporia corallincola]